MEIEATRCDDGWTVARRDRWGTTRTWYSDTGGSWRICPDGTRGSQTAGTGDVLAPRSPSAMARFLARRCDPGDVIVVEGHS